MVAFQEGPVEWIMPREGEKGPSPAFHIRLNENNFEQELQRLTEGIRVHRMPARWIVTPDATPPNAIALLETRGFRNLSSEAEEPEFGMLLHKSDFRPYYPANEAVICKRVETREDFRTWIDVVNTALHGWDMIDVQHYYVWVEEKNIQLYLGVLDGVPVATAATIQTGSAASLEFVSTLQEYRRRKAAITVSSHALSKLFANGAEAVSLSGASEAVGLYERLGFHRCFENIIMQYEG